MLNEAIAQLDFGSLCLAWSLCGWAEKHYIDN